MEQSILTTISGYLILITNNNITKLNSTKKKTKKKAAKIKRHKSEIRYSNKELPEIKVNDEVVPTQDKNLI